MKKILEWLSNLWYDWNPLVLRKQRNEYKRKFQEQLRAVEKLEAIIQQHGDW